MLRFGLNGGILLAGVLCVALVACAEQPTAPASPHWHDRATLNERKAAAAVGGFNSDESRLYHEGVQHLVNAHKKLGAFTIRQVVDLGQAGENARNEVRRKIAAAKAADEQRAQQRREQAAYEAAHHDYCKDALNDEKTAASDGVSHQAAYNAAVAGLAANENCDDEDAHLVNKAYLLSMKGLAEHYLSEGDSQTDLNQANALLVQCQTTPGLYGTHTGASCETQEQYNIHASTNWEIESNE